MPPEAPDDRLKQVTQWACRVLDDRNLHIEPISGDASFRRYLRIHPGDGRPSLVLMDAPPEKEDSRPFLDIGGRLRAAGLHAPEVLHFDLERGFGILEDLGDTLYRHIIDARSALDLFPQLFEVLATMARDVRWAGLPNYDQGRLQMELDLFPDWYLARHRNRTFSATEKRCWRSLCRSLQENAAHQAQVFVHRDFHSCNLMWRNGGPPGILDFQDAVRGPLSYDFVSLIWDRYIHWPRSQLEAWMADMRARLQPGISIDAWIRHCDLMGLQRNLKVVGIFARLRYRDRKEGYLEMIPMFYRYVLDVLPRYPEFGDFQAIVEDRSCAP